MAKPVNSVSKASTEKPGKIERLEPAVGRKKAAAKEGHQTVKVRALACGGIEVSVTSRRAG